MEQGFSLFIFILFFAGGGTGVAKIFFRGAHTTEEQHSRFEDSRWLPQLGPNIFNSFVLRNIELKLSDLR